MSTIDICHLGPAQLFCLFCHWNVLDVFGHLLLYEKPLLQPCPVRGGAKQTEAKQEGARGKPLLSQVFFEHLEPAALPSVKVFVCRKKKDKKEGGKGLAKAGSAVSLQVLVPLDVTKKNCPKVWKSQT